MEGNTIPVSENQTIIVKSSGDLFLQGQDQTEVRFQSSEDRIRVHQSPDTLYIETHASLDLEVPRGANVVLEKVGGSAFAEDLEKSLVVQKIGGDLALQRLGNVQIDKVGGNCLIADVSSDLVIGKIGGDLTVRQASGRLEANVGGDADLQLLGKGPCELRAGGDMTIYITEKVEDGMLLRAGGDTSVFLPAEVNANFALNASGETIHLSFSRQAEPVDRSIDERHYEFALGEGGPRVEVQTGGDIRVSDEPVEPESISGALESRESAWIEARERHGNPSWSAGFGYDRTSAWAEMVSRRAQEAARRAEQRANAASRRAEEHIRHAAERHGHPDWPRDFNFGFPPPPVPPAAPVSPQPVTEQERLLVLQMLQENKITVEQAEKLLAALEGRYNS
ncbi:MAG TPA: hypothetical protein VF806_05355 [Anaerolineaceae bacterium]